MTLSETSTMMPSTSAIGGSAVTGRPAIERYERLGKMAEKLPGSDVMFV